MLRIYGFLLPAFSWMNVVLMPVVVTYLVGLCLFGSIQNEASLKVAFAGFVIGIASSIYNGVMVWRKGGIHQYLDSKHKARIETRKQLRFRY
jgi:hypothetical protein